MNRIRLILVAFICICGITNATLAQTFKLTCNGESIKVNEQNDVPLSYNLNTYKYARVTYNGKPLELEIITSGFEFSNSDWDISPHSYGINGTKNGSKLSFSINQSGYLVIRFKKDQDFTKRLVIFVEPPEELPEGELVDIVKKYKIDNTGKKNETEKIQKALDEISGSGKILYFPAGKYKSFGISIKKDSKIHLAKYSRIIADGKNIKPFIPIDELGVRRFILIKDAQNIQVTGLGAFDGNGTEILSFNDIEVVKKVTSMRLLFMINCKNISFDGILLKDAASWNTHVLGCEDISFRNCKLMNNLINNEVMGSLDGWDPDASKRVLIENCFGWAGDDNVAVKCTGFGNRKILKDVEDITVRGCVFLTKKSALKIGTETRCNNYKRILFENNDIIEADRVMGINVRDKAIVDGVLFKNNRSEYYFPDRKQMGINIYITRREDNQPWTGKIKNVVIEDCSFEQKFPKKMQISRLESHTEKGDIQVKFKNLTIENKKINSLDKDYFNLSKSNGTVVFD